MRKSRFSGGRSFIAFRSEKATKSVNRRSRDPAQIKKAIGELQLKLAVPQQARSNPTTQETLGAVGKLPDDTRSRAAWLLLLAPGFIAVAIAQLLSGMRALDEFQLVFLSFAGSLLIGTATALTLWGAGTLVRLLRNGSIAEFDPVRIMSSPAGFVAALCVSVSLGIWLAKTYEGDAWFFGLTHKISLHPPLEYLLQRVEAIEKEENITEIDRLFPDRRFDIPEQRYAPYKGETVYIQRPRGLMVFMKSDQKILMGFLSTRGVDSDFRRHSLYLSPACIGQQGKDLLPIEGPGIWLDLADVSHIAFLDESANVFTCVTNPMLKNSSPAESR